MSKLTLLTMAHETKPINKRNKGDLFYLQLLALFNNAAISSVINNTKPNKDIPTIEGKMSLVNKI
jgi:hypothetical protein